MNWKFIWRGAGLALTAIGLGLVGFYLLLPSLFPAVPSGPIPPPPTIGSAAGPQPEHWPGLEAVAHYANEPPALAGSAFVLDLGNAMRVAATAAHNFNLAGGLEAIQLRPPGGSIPILELDTLHGTPGRPRLFGIKLTGDYLLLQIESGMRPQAVLMPDGRGGPLPGERVVLYAGVGEAAMKQMPLFGTIFRADRAGAWAAMDATFEPGLMSGSPILSLYTGRVVGMAVAAGQADGHTIIGMHPIGSLVEKALEAREFPALQELAR
ncbi:MAG: hypothetical protein ACRDHG_00995 [Anaerolineales bacterium]